MQLGGRIADPAEQPLLLWEPEKLLEPCDLNEIRFSRGFLRAHPGSWFPQLATHWVTLFHSLGVEAEILDASTGLSFPEELDRIVPIEVDGETAVIGLDELSQKALVQAVAPECAEIGADLAIEYVERRLLSTLMMEWSGPSPLHCYYIASNEGASVEVVGAVRISLSISGMPCTIWFGLGARALDRLDLSWRKSLFAQYQQSEADDSIHEISIDIAELAVPPALLIDYMRSGTTIDLELPVSNNVFLNLNGEPWASGVLKEYNGRFSVEIVEINSEPAPPSSNTTKVQIQIAASELDHEGVIEHSQVGAILLSKSPISTTAAMVISGERVATALIGQINGQFALNVLPK